MNILYVSVKRKIKRLTLVNKLVDNFENNSLKKISLNVDLSIENKAEIAKTTQKEYFSPLSFLRPFSLLHLEYFATPVIYYSKNT